jgi:hypothetical protein
MKMLQAGVIEPSISEWASPPMLIRKSDGKVGTDHLTCRGGGYGFLFRSKNFLRTTPVGILIFLSRKVRNFWPDCNIRLYDKNSESDFFSPPPKSEYYFQQHWESEYFF